MIDSEGMHRTTWKPGWLARTVGPGANLLFNRMPSVSPITAEVLTGCPELYPNVYVHLYRSMYREVLEITSLDPRRSHPNRVGAEHGV